MRWPHSQAPSVADGCVHSGQTHELENQKQTLEAPIQRPCILRLSSPPIVRHNCTQEPLRQTSGTVPLAPWGLSRHSGSFAFKVTPPATGHCQPHNYRSQGNAVLLAGPFGVVTHMAAPLSWAAVKGLDSLCLWVYSE